jgi:hypothetical protein
MFFNLNKLEKIILKPKSQTLFHFTKNIEVIKNILKNGFWPRYCLEDFTWYVHNLDYVAFPMVCYCDIPLSRINEHVDFYGEYGIGVTREWAISNKLNPVSYINSSSDYSMAINNIAERISRESEHQECYRQFHEDTTIILSHIKPIEGRMLVDGSRLIEKEFYQENEWRYVPKNIGLIEQWLHKDTFNNQKELNKNNDLTKTHCMLKISPNDIKYIFVKSDTDIPNIINFIQSEMDSYTSNELKILMSRVVSLESISKDL